MGELQDAIDRSMASANEVTREMLAHLELSEDEMISFVNTAGAATIATANAKGVPHAAVVIAACAGEDIYFTVTPGSVMARNLADRPSLAFTICYGDRAVMGQGTGVLVGEARDLEQLIATLAACCLGGAFTPPGWEGLVYRIEIKRIVAG